MYPERHPPLRETLIPCQRIGEGVTKNPRPESLPIFIDSRGLGSAGLLLERTASDSVSSTADTSGGLRFCVSADPS